jgi:uncharacterized membrane protein
MQLRHKHRGGDWVHFPLYSAPRLRLRPFEFRKMRSGAARGVPRLMKTSDKVLRWTWWVVLPLALVCAAVVPSYLSEHNFALAFAIRKGFALVCHQRAERCFWVVGAPVAVCARCLGIYVGAVVGLLIRMPRRVSLRLFMGAATLNVLDVGTEFLGLHGNWMVVRFGLGVGVGAAAALLISSSMPEPRLRADSASA